jgi:hypothetical protein
MGTVSEGHGVFVQLAPDVAVVAGRDERPYDPAVGPSDLQVPPRVIVNLKVKFLGWTWGWARGKRRAA